MATLIERGSDFLDNRLRRGADKEVTYETPDFAVPLAATPGARDDEVDPVDEASLSARLMDWLVRADDLRDPGGRRFDPDKGHKITHEHGGVREVWKALPDKQDRVWRPVDQLGVRLRIHTKLIETERTDG